MAQALSKQTIKSQPLIGHAAAKSSLTKLAAWISDRNLSFLITSIGLIVMLLWAGSYKMTAPGAEGIVPLVSNSPLISWHFKLFGTYIGSDLIGLTELIAALLMIAGYLRPKGGIIGALIATGMFSITSTMVITTPGAIISGSRTKVHEFSRPVPFRGCHIPRRIPLLGQLFRPKSYPFRKQSQ